MNSDIAIIFIKVLSKTSMSKKNNIWAWWLHSIVVVVVKFFFSLFFSVLELVLMHFTTRRFVAREERRGNFSLKFPVSRNSALFCLFLPLLCLRRFVFLFLLLFILISVVLFFLVFSSVLFFEGYTHWSILSFNYAFNYTFSFPFFFFYLKDIITFLDPRSLFTSTTLVIAWRLTQKMSPASSKHEPTRLIA